MRQNPKAHREARSSRERTILFSTSTSTSTLSTSYAMPNSIVSLEPLSSPSPSPPPPEANNTSGAGFDTDSELSDLTEDEQENDTRTNDDDSDEVRNPTRTKRRKRGGIVPEPMWGWAKPKKDEPKHKVVEEEEEGIVLLFGGTYGEDGESYRGVEGAIVFAGVVVRGVEVVVVVVRVGVGG